MVADGYNRRPRTLTEGPWLVSGQGPLPSDDLLRFAAHSSPYPRRSCADAGSCFPAMARLPRAHVEAAA